MELMSWVTVVFSMTAAACLTLALIYGFIWWQQRSNWADLLFALAAAGTATLAWTDLAGMLAQSTAQMGLAFRWAHVSVWVVVLALAGFVRHYLRAGRMWLFWTVCGLRTISLALNFLTGENLNYREITSLSHLALFGETVASVAQGIPNPWMVVGQVSMWALLLFVADATITVWRRGDRRMAVSMGGSILFFLLAGTAQTALLVWGNAPWPSTPSLFFLGIILAMGCELGREALRAAQLARDLHASKQRIALAAEAATLGFWFREFAASEICATDQWRALFGFAQSERLHLDVVLQRLHPDDREIARHMLENENRDDTHKHTELRVLMPDGQMRWIASRGSVELDSRDRPIHLQGVSWDITQRKQAELQAQAHRSEVAHLLRVASLGELSSALAHELSQPLSAILSNAQAAELFLAREKLDLDEIRHILRDIVADDKRAADVIVRLRALLRRGEFQPTALEANQLIQEVLELMHYELMTRDVRIVTQLSNGLPAIRGDRVELQQVLINLILNANDAMSQPNGSARTLTLASGLVDGDVIRISVADTGTGIPPGSEERIFEPYHTTKPGGLGLGLSLSRSIMLAHGGRLWAETQVSSGATFHLTVPEWPGTSG